MKHCPKCQKLKSRSSFYSNKSRKDGISSYCRLCFNVVAKNWREKNPDFYKDWRETNKEKRKEYANQWYKDNKEHHNAKTKQWYKDNRE